MTIRYVLMAGTMLPALVGISFGEATPLIAMERLQVAQAAQPRLEKKQPADAPEGAPSQQKPAPSSPRAEPKAPPEAPRAAPAVRAQPPAERVAPQSPRAANPPPATEPSRPTAAPTPEKPMPQGKPEAVRPHAVKPPDPAPAAHVAAPEAPRGGTPAAPVLAAPAVAPRAQAPKPAIVPPTPTVQPRPTPPSNGSTLDPAVRAVVPAGSPPPVSTPGQFPLQRPAAPSPQPTPRGQPRIEGQPATAPGTVVPAVPNGGLAPARPVAGQPGTGQPGAGQPGGGQPAAGQPGAGKPGAGRPVPPVPTPANPTTPAVPPTGPALGGAAQPTAVAPNASDQRGATNPVITPTQPTPATPPLANAPTAAPTSGQAQPAGRPPQQPGTATAPASSGQIQGQRRDGGNGTGVAIGAAAGLVGGFIAAQGLQHLDEVRSRRQEYDQDGVDYVREPGRTIVRENDHYFVTHDENERFRDLGYAVRTERRGADNLAIYDRPDGVQILTYTTDDGRLLRRVRRFPDGRQIVLIDNGPDGPPRRYDQDVIVLPPPPLDIPRDRYIVDADGADEPLLYDTFAAPPVEPIARRYTLDEVRYSPTIRARMRSVDLNAINFETGSWTVTPDQARHLKAIAQAIGQAIGRNPQEVFLIEGYTDAVGQDVDNLSLSDRRAQAVATILTTDFQVPPENLTTQGYGAQNLKEPTRGPSAINRRVTIRRITPLIADATAPR